MAERGPAAAAALRLAGDSELAAGKVGDFATATGTCDVHPSTAPTLVRKIAAGVGSGAVMGTSHTASESAASSASGIAAAAFTLRLYPQHASLFVDLNLRGQRGVPDVWLGTYPADMPLDLSDVADGALDVTVFLAAEAHPSAEDLAGGAYSKYAGAGGAGALRVPGSELRKLPRLPVDTFTVTKDAGGLAPAFRDTGADLLELCFRYRDAVVRCREFNGKFENDERTPFSFSRVTDDNGKVTLALPAGRLSGSVAAVDRVVVKGEIRETPAPMAVEHSLPGRCRVDDASKAPAEAASVEVAAACTVLTTAVMDRSRPVLLLGDVSGSMASGNRMECLRTTLLGLYDQAAGGGSPVVMAAWNSWIRFCCPGAPGNSTDELGPVRPLTVADCPAACRWVTGLRAGGGNNMRFIIEAALRAFPAAADVYVMCDGDINPFSTADGADKRVGEDLPKPAAEYVEGSGNYSWAAFRARFPAARFHFVAFSEGADHGEMARMARIGNGRFTSANRRG